MDTPAVESQKGDRNPSLIRISDFDFLYGDKQALFDINMDIAEREVTAFIGPSGCGKSTLLRSINRMNDLIESARIDRGKVEFNGVDIYDERVDATELRKRIGMVFQKSNPFPKSIYENVAYGLRIQGEKSNAVIDERVEWALKSAALWEEVKDRLKDSALGLSGGQQQRVAVARALVFEPKIVLMDEPLGALDKNLRESMQYEIKHIHESIGVTVVYVTHDQGEALTMSNRIAVFNDGKVQQLSSPDKLYEELSLIHI